LTLRKKVNLIKNELLKTTLNFLLNVAFVLCFSFGTNAQIINTIAGTGSAAYSGDGTPAVSAEINTPFGVAVDVSGNVFIADYGNNRIRKIDNLGIITTIAGTGIGGFSGEGGPGTAAKIYGPRGITVDASGNVFFSDYANNRIRKISTSGIITTVAGNGLPGFFGDGGPATDAKLNFAWGVAVDAAGNIYIADQLNCRIRKVNTSGIITTIAGTGIAFFSGDGGPAISAGIQYPLGLAVDASGNIYIADNGDNRIRMINTSGIISTLAGSPTYGFSGDGGPSTAAQLYYPQGVAVDTGGNIYICDLNNNRIRKINSSGIISSIVGNGTAGFTGDGGPASLAEINQSTGVAVDLAGRVYIADNNNNRIRMIHTVTHNPFFTHGHSQTLTFCPVEVVSLDTMLTVFDIDTGQTETWSVVLPAAHGIALCSYVTTSTGSILTPTGTIYTPATGYVGSDSIKVRVTDGTYSDTTTIYITILPLPDPGLITGADSVCVGDSVTLSDISVGGVWSSSNTAISTVSGTGEVTGISPGTSIITYSVTNTCGTRSASFVLVSADCKTGLTTINRPANGYLDISPNPGSNLFAIKLETAQAENVQYSITNLLGEKINEINSESNRSITIQSDLPPGIYFITAITAHGRWTGRLTVVK
jgi:Secretion system C-terminal sorting domain/NHL repeat